MPLLSALDSAKSMMRVLPPKNTPGLARRSVSSIRRLPRPPASTKAIASRARRPLRLLGFMTVSSSSGPFEEHGFLGQRRQCQLDRLRPAVRGYTGCAVISPNGAPTFDPP